MCCFSGPHVPLRNASSYADRRSRELAGRLDLIGKVCRGALIRAGMHTPQCDLMHGNLCCEAERVGRLVSGHACAFTTACTTAFPTAMAAGGEGGGQGQQPDGGRGGRNWAQEGGVAPGEWWEKSGVDGPGALYPGERHWAQAGGVAPGELHWIEALQRVGSRLDGAHRSEPRQL